MFAVAVASAVGCNAIYGVEDLSYEGASSSASSGTGGSTSSSSSTGQGGGAGPCAYDDGGCRCFLGDGGCTGLPNLAGWDTGVLVYSGAQDGAPSDGKVVVVGSTAPDVGEVVCPSCSCGAPDGTCDVQASFYDTSSCSGAVLSLAFDESQCTAITNAAPWDSVILSFQTGGVCPPSGTPTFDANTFVAVYASPVSCPEGCLPIPESGFDARFCVLRGGKQPCPEGFAAAHDVYAADAFCTDCTCGPPAGLGCNFNLHYDDGACAGSFSTTTVDGACLTLTAPEPQSGQTEITAAGTCQPGGGAPMGAEPAVSHTLCCRDET